MSETGSINGNVWKWVAALLATALFAGLPGYVGLYVNSPKREEVDLIRDRQDVVLQRLAAIDVRLSNLDVADTGLQIQLEQIRDELQQLQGGK